MRSLWGGLATQAGEAKMKVSHYPTPLQLRSGEEAADLLRKVMSIQRRMRRNYEARAKAANRLQPPPKEEYKPTK